MFTNLVTHLGDDVIVLSIDGCSSFVEYVSNIVNISEVDVVDEENEDALVERSQLRRMFFHSTIQNMNLMILLLQKQSNKLRLHFLGFYQMS